MCFHILLLLISYTFVRDILNLEAMVFAVRFSLHNSLMVMTSVSHNFAIPLISPLVCLPLAMQSKAFDLASPKKRWFGLTQERISQVCKTIFLGGISPLNNEKDALCAGAYLTPIVKTPYPNLFNAPRHIQQLFVFSIIELKRLKTCGLSFLHRLKCSFLQNLTEALLVEGHALKGFPQ